jgi:phenylacetic acid degradation protein paaN
MWRHAFVVNADPGGVYTMTQSTTTARESLVDKHSDTLDRAVRAIHDRGYWSVYPESPSPRVYGEQAAAEGLAAFEARLGKPFPVSAPGTGGQGGQDQVGDERSPYGLPLDVTYPRVTDPEALLQAAHAAIPGWRDAGPRVRAAACLEMLARINAASFEMANAVMHTTGQPFVMAFQAAGPHAQDRGLEAVAYAYDEMARVPATAYWEKPQGKRDPLRMEKTFHLVPRGVGLVIGCNTFPTWNAYPGLFASLATGNAVVVKPHPRATLPLALTVAICRDTLSGLGFDPNLVCLAAEGAGGRLAATLATHPLVKIVDFTGSPEFGEWLERNAAGAQVYTEKAGVNTVVVDSCDDFGGMCANLAFSLSLYSGQMCTTPQDILIPRDGITTEDGHKTFEEVARGIAAAVGTLLGDDARAVELLGAIVSDAVLSRVEQAPSLGEVVLASRQVTHPTFPGAVVRSPALVRVDAADEPAYARECFGPVAFLVATDSTEHSLTLFRRLVSEHGAITAAVYSTDDKVLAAAEDAAVAAGVALSCNLTGGVYVNQSAAFSDFHATGANPAANAALTDSAFVAGRFRVIQSRRHVPAPPA